MTKVTQVYIIRVITGNKRIVNIYSEEENGSLPHEPEETQPKPEIVLLNQEFVPFPSEKTQNMDNSGRGVELSRILLRTEILPDIPILFRLGYTTYLILRQNSFSPFDMSLGYQVTDEDFNWEKKIKKLKSLDLDERIDHKLNPLSISAQALGIRMEERGFYKEPTDPTKRVLTDEASDIISGLRLQLIFPQIEFESDEPSITNLSIDFEYFYPIDKGPLIPKERPIPQEYIDMKRLELKSLGIRLRPSEGLWLHLPADANKLAQIKAKFVLKPKQ